MTHDKNDTAGQQEIEVDKEALVKILARYPGTFDVLRELIQNADDAEARSIQIHFQTREPGKSQSTSELEVHKWIIKNDGGGFGQKDWKKLGKIARGNDDSSKVGAFGVGFYSVLSKSDRPVVKSNGKLLQFQKRGKLYKSFVDCPTDSWTSVELELRNPERLPALVDLTRFLVSSVAFLTNIHTFSVYIDSQLVLDIRKQMESQVEIPIPEHLKPTTPEGTLTVPSIQRTVQSIIINADESAFPSSSTSTPSKPTAEELAERCIEESRPIRTFGGVHRVLKDNTITHDLYTATTSVNLDPESEMKRGVESSTKRLPSDFKCKAVYFNSEQYGSLVDIKHLKSPKAKHFARLLFGSQGIIPENDSGRLFIGQSTNQTTGIGLHISAHLLPTMERGSIDLANGQVAAWNKEVLCVGGFLARVIYEQEMSAAKSKGGQAATEVGLCTMARFAFGLTVPHGGVSKILQDAFYSCCHELKSPFPIVSDVGISCASDPRCRHNNKPPAFLRTYVVLHEDMMRCQRSEIINRYKISQFRFDDIVQEFQSGVTQDAMKSFFIWWDDFNKTPPSTPSAKEAREKFCKQFASQGILLSGHGVKIALKDIKHYTYLPLPIELSPPDTIHVNAMPGPTKGAVECFGWTQLPLLHWLEYACSQARHPPSNVGPGQVSDMGYRILRVLVQFSLVESLSSEHWGVAAELMKGLECIPTNKGREFPLNSYFEVADVCGSLPVADYPALVNIPPIPVAVETGFQSKSVDQEHVGMVLLRIGVRPAMNWVDMIGSLETIASGISNYRLLRYLTLIHNGNLEEQELNDLQNRRVFYSENHGRAPATELYYPDEHVRNLGLPILSISQEAIDAIQSNVGSSSTFSVETFIESLGIRKYPTLDKIISLAASGKPTVRRLALHYFLRNLEGCYGDYKPENFAEHPFIPTKCKSYARLNEVFASPIWEKLGFKQPSQEFARDLWRLGVKDSPSIDTIIECFKNPQRRPSDIATATTWFGLLHSDGKLPLPKLQEEVSTIPFVPVKNLDPLSAESSPIKYICPKDCLITSDETKEHHRRIFPFVNFGQNGNSFLDSCRAKKSPDASDIVSKMLENPQRYLEALQNDIVLYLEDLGTVASRFESIPEDDKQAMKTSAMFPAFRNGVPADKLLRAEQVLISDWAGRDFARNVLVAPGGDALEKMYREMGSEFLGTCVQHVVTLGDPAECSPPFNREEVVRRIGYFMSKRDKGSRKGVSFSDEDSTNKLLVKACKSLTLKETFVPPYEVPADATPTLPTKPGRVRKNAGFEIGETDGSYTLWMVGSRELLELHHDIAVALCHVLLKTYGPDDVGHMTALFATNDAELERYYPGGSESSSDHDTKVKRTKKPKEPKTEVAIPFPLPPCLARLASQAGLTVTWNHVVNQQTISPEDDIKRAIRMCGSDQGDKNLGQSDLTHAKKYDKHCKQPHTIKLIPKRDKATNITYYLARGAQYQAPSQIALKEFDGLISELANVFGKSPEKTCFIFWKDTDDDLMAFNRDQKYIFLNLAHYNKFYYDKKDVDKKKVVTEWYLIMIHEIAHNVTMDHDEHHGMLSAQLAVRYFPALQKQFNDISWEGEQQPQTDCAPPK